MWPVTVVVSDPRSQPAVSLLGVLIEPCVCPLSDGGLDEPFRLSVCSWSVDFCASVLDAAPGAFSLEQVGDEAWPVIGHDAAKGDFMASEVFGCLAKKQACRNGLFVRHHGGIGDAGVIIDGDVEELPSGAARLILGI